MLRADLALRRHRPEMQWRTGEAPLIKVNGTTTRTAFHRRPYRSCSTRTVQIEFGLLARDHAVTFSWSVMRSGQPAAAICWTKRSRRSRTRHWSPSPGTGGPQARPCRVVGPPTELGSSVITWLSPPVMRLTASLLTPHPRRQKDTHASSPHTSHPGVEFRANSSIRGRSPTS
jgi:hypothetical protein